MAKKKRSRPKPKPKQKAAALPSARIANPKSSVPPDQPAFWFGFGVSWAKLVTARVVVFGLLALDALLQIRHAPRYGAGDFNVAQLGFLDSLGPGRAAYGICQLAIAFLMVVAALGVATRVVLPIATLLYAWLYFGSQLDSYQHHYLVALVLGIACFVPWERPEDEEPPTVVRSWALRLLLVQLGIMYLWAAISKLDATWLDGTTLSTQITGGMRSLIESTVGFKGASWIVVLTEFALAATVWLRPAWRFAAPLGLLFHIGIVVTGFEIGLFAYVMCGLYILVIPDVVWVALGNPLRPLGARLHALATRPGWAIVGAGLVIAIGLALLVRLPHALGVTLAMSALVVALAVRAMMRDGQPRAAFGIAPTIALVLWLVVDRSTTVAVDYYRFWGGSQRRIGDRAEAEAAYRGLLEIEPDSEIAHFYLGRLLIATDRADEGLEQLHAAQRDEPGRARAFVEEARYLARSGRSAEALAKAKEAVFADPSDQEARAMLDSLTKARPAPQPTPEREP